MWQAKEAHRFGFARSKASRVKYANPQEHLKAWQTDGLSGWIKQQLRAQVENENRDNHRAAFNSNSR
jgi:hypothetical protein